MDDGYGMLIPDVVESYLMDSGWDRRAFRSEQSVWVLRSPQSVHIVTIPRDRGNAEYGNKMAMAIYGVALVDGRDPEDLLKKLLELGAICEE